MEKHEVQTNPEQNSMLHKNWSNVHGTEVFTCTRRPF